MGRTPVRSEYNVRSTGITHQTTKQPMASEIIPMIITDSLKATCADFKSWGKEHQEERKRLRTSSWLKDYCERRRRGRVKFFFLSPDFQWEVLSLLHVSSWWDWTSIFAKIDYLFQAHPEPSSSWWSLLNTFIQNYLKVKLHPHVSNKYPHHHDLSPQMIIWLPKNRLLGDAHSSELTQDEKKQEATTTTKTTSLYPLFFSYHLLPPVSSSLFLPTAPKSLEARHTWSFSCWESRQKIRRMKEGSRRWSSSWWASCFCSSSLKILTNIHSLLTQDSSPLFLLLLIFFPSPQTTQTTIAVLLLSFL